MHRRSVLVPLILVVLALIMAVGLRGSTQTFQNLIPNFSGVQTAAVATFASNLTQTALARPTPTAPSTPTGTSTRITVTAIEGSATPTSSCYRLRWIKDVSVPDFSPMNPGESFTKTWRVLNNGSCAWPPGFRFGFYGGDPMGGSNFTLTDTVNPGKQVDLSISMTAPSGTGIIISTWRMSDPSGWFFGDALTVKIDLGGETATP
ncbi:MAG TPA: NBR1-Ig-like domain-containing protein [Anaerolineales bacterium]|nr:NBR1-Ig-like domain-containing protein [Anaerolineales bacterium]